MIPDQIIQGEFYIHQKCHHGYIGTSDNKLVSLAKGVYMRPPEDEKVKNNYWTHFRVALPSEVLLALSKNKFFKRTSIYQKSEEFDKKEFAKT